MTTDTANAQVAAAGAMLAMVTAFSNLPTVNLALERFSDSWGVRLDAHEGLDTFEQWREALGVDPFDVDQDQAGTLAWLTTHVTYAGVPVKMYGYYDAPDTESDE